MSEKNKQKEENPISKYLKKNKVKKQEFAKSCNLSRCHLHKILRGDAAPRAKVIKKIIEAAKGCISIEEIRDYEAKFAIYRPHTNPLGSSWGIWEEKLR